MVRASIWQRIITPLRLSLVLLFFATAPTEAAPDCANPEALGTSRILKLGVEGGLAVGFKSYPQSLALQDHEIVLTFDDGPLPATTTKVLDALSRECVLATFFLIGRNAAANPSLVQRQLRAGHTIGHHSWSHPSVTMRGLSEAAARADIERGFIADDQAAYGSASSAPRVGFFRYPGFADTPALNAWLASRQIGVFGADIWASDWYPMTPGAQLQLLMSRVEKARRGIILLHDTRGQTVAMLPDFLRALKRGGYKIVHLVPASGQSPTIAAEAGWKSETEAILSTLLPRLQNR